MMLFKIKRKISLLLAFGYLFLIVRSAEAGVSVPSAGLPASDIKTVLTTFLNWLLGILGAVAIISFVISGIQYLTAAGDEDRMETAKNNLFYSIIGVIVALSGFVIIQAVDTALRGMSTQF